MVYGHVRIFLNFVRFTLIVLIKSFYFIFFKTGFVINKKPPLIQEQLGMIRLGSSAIFAGEHFG